MEYRGLFQPLTMCHVSALRPLTREMNLLSSIKMGSSRFLLSNGSPKVWNPNYPYLKINFIIISLRHQSAAAADVVVPLNMKTAHSSPRSSQSNTRFRDLPLSLTWLKLLSISSSSSPRTPSQDKNPSKDWMPYLKCKQLETSFSSTITLRTSLASSLVSQLNSTSIW